MQNYQFILGTFYAISHLYILGTVCYYMGIKVGSQFQHRLL